MTRAWIAALVLPLTACGGSDAANDPEAVNAAAQEQADRFSSGDFAGAWEMWTDDAKAAVPQEAYVEYSEACAGTGMPLEAGQVRIEDEGEAVVRISLGKFAQSYSMAYEGDEWRWVPTDDTLDSLAEGADAAIENATTEGTCA